eukprot:195730-Alexandrium_andersonii.AAC.1
MRGGRAAEAAAKEAEIAAALDAEIAAAIFAEGVGMEVRPEVHIAASRDFITRQAREALQGIYEL